MDCVARDWGVTAYWIVLMFGVIKKVLEIESGDGCITL